MFQSPRPTRDATELRVRSNEFVAFQSPRPTRDATGSDRSVFRVCKGFNPRVPRGTRLIGKETITVLQEFQSPRPTRDATFLPVF